jgi:hypothetical protein
MKTSRMPRVAFIIACSVLFSTAGFAQATKKRAPKTATAKADAVLVDLNTASKNDLMRLPASETPTRRRSSPVGPTRRRTNSLPRRSSPRRPTRRSRIRCAY